MIKRLVTALVLFSTSAGAAPAVRKYHFELTGVATKAGSNNVESNAAQLRVERQVKKAFTGHPQLVAELQGAPDPQLAADAYRQYLAKKKLSGSYAVSVEITEASQEITAMEGKPNARRLVVRIAIHVLGETIPGQTMGFTGDGHATVKLEIGAKVRDSDVNFAWDSAAETAVEDALKTCFAKLAKPKPQSRPTRAI